MADNIKCTHCGNKRPALGFAPFPNALGQRIATEICQPCWSEWLQKQTQILHLTITGWISRTPMRRTSCSTTSRAFYLAMHRN